MSLNVETVLRDPGRLAALRALALLDSAIDPAFDRLTRLATKVLGVPTALVSLVDEDRQFFKSCVGLSEPWAAERQTPLSHSFCQYAVATGEPFIVENAREHPLVDTNLAIEALDVVAYAGIPLVTSDGFVIGTVCVIDRVPRSWTADEIETLRDLTGMVITEIELRGEIAERRRMMRERDQLLERERTAREAAERAQARFALLADVSSLLAASLDPDVSLPELADLLSCSLADRCELYLYTPSLQLQLSASSHPRSRPLLPSGLCADSLGPRWENHDVVRVLRTRKSRLLEHVANAGLTELTDDGNTDAAYPTPPPAALIVAPIAGGETVHGLLLCSVSRQEQPCDADDVALVEEIGKCIATAVTNAKLYREAVQALRTRDDVLAVVTHDLRNPMQTMQIYATVLQHYAQRHDFGKAVIEEAVAQIGRAGAKMSRLLAELSDVAMQQAGQSHRLRCSPVELVGLVGEVVAQHQAQIKRHEIRVASSASEVVAVLDRERIERLLVNLLANALKYSPDGGEINVVVGHEQHDETRWITVEVSDQGCGIPEGDLPHIFEPFFRASNVPSSLRGMGLGLASVQQIVEQHRGTIHVTSREGAGTTFTVRLPDADGCGKTEAAYAVPGREGQEQQPRARP